MKRTSSPRPALGGVGGYLFGALGGAAYSIIGVLLGSALVFVAARAYGRPYAERVVAGLTDIRLRTFLAVVLVGRTPSFLAVAYAGGALSSGQTAASAAVAGLLAAAAALVYAATERGWLARAG